MYFLSTYRKHIYSVRDIRRLFTLSSAQDANSEVLPMFSARSLSSNATISDKTSIQTLPASIIFESFLNSSNHELDERISQTSSPLSTFASPQTMFDNHISLVEMIKRIPEKVNKMHSKVVFDEETMSAANNQGGLFVNQVVLEEKQLSEAMKSYEQMTGSLIKMGRGTGMKRIQKTMLQWFETFRDEIAAEAQLVETHAPGTDRAEYGPALLLIPADKLAAMVLDVILNEIMRHNNRTVIVTSLSSLIGEAVESELYSEKLKKGIVGTVSWKHQLAQKLIKNTQGGKTKGKGLNMRLMKLIDDVKLTTELKIRIGAVLISLLIRTAKLENGNPAFRHFYSYLSRNRLTGQVELNPELFATIVPEAKGTSLPRYLPMVIPPKKWNNKKGVGCYWVLKASLMRTFSDTQLRALSRAHIDKVLEGLNYLGQVPWRINPRIHSVVKEAWEVRKLSIGELPEQVNQPIPEKSSFYKLVTKEYLAEHPELKVVPMENIPLGNIPSSESPSSANATTSSSANTNGTTATATASAADSEQVLVYNERQFKRAVRRVASTNGDLHSLRCDMTIKLKIAAMFEDDRIYFPYSMDFRGRAYPVPPNLNHLGSDMARGLLWFHEAKPLGPRGLTWLKVHLANLFGYNKITHAERERWADGFLSEARDSASDPLDGGKWWMTAEEPFQALATCIEIINAIDCPEGHENYLCRLPVHQDGSCNGLQHYAALGKDEQGGKAVNVSPSETPQDVYSKVLEVVLQRIEKDSQLPESIEEVMNNFELYFPQEALVVDKLYAEKVAATPSRNKRKKHKNNSNSMSQSIDSADSGDSNTATKSSSQDYSISNDMFNSNSSNTAHNENNEDFGVNPLELFRNEYKLKKAKDLVTKGSSARMVRGMVNRKVIKQTVMTSVYGVTRLGARLQVQSKLEEKIVSLLSKAAATAVVEQGSDGVEQVKKISPELLETLLATDDVLLTDFVVNADGSIVTEPSHTPQAQAQVKASNAHLDITNTSAAFTSLNINNISSSSGGSGSGSVVGPAAVDMEMIDKSVFQCSRYVANCTLDSLADVFHSAQLIMDWLADCASKLAEHGETVTWITPLGLPVIQPYRKNSTHVIKTVLQSITLAYNHDDLPVSANRQKSAFPPNFVHSLDATHMLLTCLKMKARNLTFASVHDSFWTHACDIDVLNELVRDAFVELYEQPILENLRSSLVMRYPHIEFQPVPERGRLDIRGVRQSTYFFH